MLLKATVRREVHGHDQQQHLRLLDFSNTELVQKGPKCAYNYHYSITRIRIFFIVVVQWNIEDFSFSDYC